MTMRYTPDAGWARMTSDPSSIIASAMGDMCGPNNSKIPTVSTATASNSV